MILEQTNFETEQTTRNPNNNGFVNTKDMKAIFDKLKAGAPKTSEIVEASFEEKPKSTKVVSEDKFYEILAKEGVSERYIRTKRENLIDYELGMLKYKKEAQEAIEAKKTIFLLGKVGLGKSFLAYELIHDLKKENPMDIRAYCNRATLIVSDYKANYSNIDYMINKIFFPKSYWFEAPNEKSQLVVIDELHNLKNLEDYSIIDEIIITAYEKMIPLILIGNYDYKHLKESLADNAWSRVVENHKAFKASGEDLRLLQRTKNGQ